MIEMIENLIEKGNAYEKQGHVLFSVPSMPDYGQLSGRNRDEQIAGARVDVAPYKNDPLILFYGNLRVAMLLVGIVHGVLADLAGFIECSAMSKMYLGETFDIPRGGIDLIFPS